MKRLVLSVAACSILLPAPFAAAQTPPPAPDPQSPPATNAAPPAPATTTAAPPNPTQPPPAPVGPMPPLAAGSAPNPYYPPYPSHGYPYPYAVPGWTNPAELPNELPYDGGPVPYGFKVEEKYSMGLLIAGPVLFALAYTAAAFTGSGTSSSFGRSHPRSTLFIPITGPFAYAAVTQNGDGFIYVFEGLAQLTGVGLFLGGILNPKPRLVKRGVANYEPMLHVGPRSMQLELKF